MSNDTLEITDQNFSAEVLDAELPVLVDFWATWCGPCRAIGPVIDRLATSYKGAARVGKVNVDASPRTAQTFGIRSIPTLLVFKGGRVVDTIVGAQPAAHIETVLQRHLGTSAA